MSAVISREVFALVGIMNRTVKAEAKQKTTNRERRKNRGNSLSNAADSSTSTKDLLA
jgi:hypothetical protein